MIIALLISLLPVASSNIDSAWSKEAIVRQGIDPVVRFQARFERGYLIVRATHANGWHTYAMDNALRANTALKGKKSLGIEQGIEIQVESGLELGDVWLQTEPRDFSKPELRWFTYGFDQTALFVCRVKRITADQVILPFEARRVAATRVAKSTSPLTCRQSTTALTSRHRLTQINSKRH